MTAWKKSGLQMEEKEDKNSFYYQNENTKPEFFENQLH